MPSSSLLIPSSSLLIPSSSLHLPQQPWHLSLSMRIVLSTLPGAILVASLYHGPPQEVKSCILGEHTQTEELALSQPHTLAPSTKQAPSNGVPHMLLWHGSCWCLLTGYSQLSCETLGPPGKEAKISVPEWGVQRL